MGEAARTVLIVDDEPLVLHTTAEILAEDGCAVFLAGGYDEALARLEAAPDTDVLVTDISFSEGPDGIALARAVAARWPRIRIVIVSGEVRPSGHDYPENALFFTKPYAPGALRTMVREGAEWARG
jgi:CheY-like chemotaxis protein